MADLDDKEREALTLEAIKAAFEESSGVLWGPDADLTERASFSAGYRAALAAREEPLILIPEEFYAGMNRTEEEWLRARIVRYTKHKTFTGRGIGRDLMGHLLLHDGQSIGTVSDCVWCLNMTRERNDG